MYPKTVPYVYCGLAESTYHTDPLGFLQENYKTHIDQHISIKERESEEGWVYILFENKENNTLIVAFRGTDLSKLASELIVDLFNEIGDPRNKQIVRAMSRNVSNWMDKYNNNHQYDEVTFVGHSEGGLYARFVLCNDPRIKYRITFNTANPENLFNFRCKDDPVSWITGTVTRDVEVLFKRGPIDDAVVWTICEGIHGMHWFSKIGVLIDEDNKRKTWQKVKGLTNKFKQCGWMAEELVTKRWWDVGEKHGTTEHLWTHFKIAVVALLIIATSIITARKLTK
eukprot:236484_1